MLIFFSLIISLYRCSSYLEDLPLGQSFNITKYNNHLYSFGQKHSSTRPELIFQANHYYLDHPLKIRDRTKGKKVLFVSTAENCPDTAHGVPLWKPPRHEVYSNSCMTQLSNTSTVHDLWAARVPPIRGYPPIHGFFHITLNATSFLSRQENLTIFETQLQKLNKSGLLEESSLTLRIGLHDVMVNKELTFCVKEAIKRRIKVFAKGAIIQWVNPSYYECRTILTMKEWCSNNKNSIVYYLHNKGFTHLKDPGLFSNVKQWREFMMFFLFERWTLCANSLTNGAATCGVHIEFNPYMHFKGNFWWASCNHMVRVTTRCPPGVTFRHAAEFWLMANTGLFSDAEEVVELWDGKPSFFRPYPRYHYSCADWVQSIESMIQQTSLD